MMSFVNQSINLTLCYSNNELDFAGIDDTGLFFNISMYNGTTIVKSWTSNQYIGNGHYKITLNNTGLDCGDYFLNISFNKLNYDREFVLINYTIDPFHSILTLFNTTQNLTVNNVITNWEEHNISFSIQWNSTVYNKSNPYSGFEQEISNAFPNFGTIIWSIKDSSNTTLITGSYMVFNVIDKKWYINNSDSTIPLKDIEGSGNYLSPGNYQLFVNFTGLHLKNETRIFILNISPKAQSRVDLINLPTSTQVFTYLNIRIKLTIDNDVPPNFYEQFVNLTMIIYYDDGRTETQNLVFDDIKSEGTDQKQIFVAFGISSISIRIHYYSLDEDWPLYSATNCIGDFIPIQVGNIFKIIIPIVILGTIALGGVIGISLYRSKIKSRREQKVLDKSEKTFSYFNDLINIRKVIIINKNNGNVLYGQNFNKADFPPEIQEEIIMKAMNLGDIKGYYSSIDVIRYEDLILIIDDATYVRSIFIMEEFPTRNFLRGIVKFVQFYEINNLNAIKKGMKLKDGIETHNLLVHVFDIGIIEPYRVTMKGINMKLTSIQTELLSIAHDMSQDGYFFISALFDKIKSESLLPELSIFKEINLLIQKKAIERISLEDFGTLEVKYYEPSRESKEEIRILETDIPVKKKGKDEIVDKIGDIKTKVDQFEPHETPKPIYRKVDSLTPFEKMKMEHKLTPEEERDLTELDKSDIAFDLPMAEIEPEVKLTKAEEETEIKLPKIEEETEINLPKPEDDED